MGVCRRCGGSGVVPMKIWTSNNTSGLDGPDEPNASVECPDCSMWLVRYFQERVERGSPLDKENEPLTVFGSGRD